VNAILHTTVAHTLVIVATSPLWAALIGRLALGERLDMPTFIAILTVLTGMLLVVGQTQQPGSWLGNAAALVSAVAIAATFVLNRKNKHINMVPAISISGLIAALIALPFANFVSLDAYSVWLLLMMGALVAVAFALITIASRYIPAAEVSLILPLETVGGTALVWFFLGETPGTQTILGALLILVALIAHAYFVLKRTQGQR
jgi:drug/metabolite transporter (DMT)-like permease